MGANDRHLNVIERSTENYIDLQNKEDDPLIYIFEDKTYSEDEIKEIGLNLLIQKYGPVKDLKRKKSI